MFLHKGVGASELSAVDLGRAVTWEWRLTTATASRACLGCLCLRSERTHTLESMVVFTGYHLLLRSYRD